MATGRTVGLGVFDANVETWEQYTERLGYSFEANGITDAGKKRLSYFALGSRTKDLFVNIQLNSPAKPGDKSYADFVTLLKRHFNPEPSEIVERYKFHNRVRQPTETVTEYVAELRAIARYCNFKEFLDDSLRDRLVCGIGDDAIQRRLLSEPKLTFSKAMDIAVSMETAQESLTELVNKKDDSTVHKVTGGSESTTCYRCNGSHAPDKCKFKISKCHSCGKTGHIQRACRSTPNVTTKPIRRFRGGKKPQVVKQLSEEHICSINNKEKGQKAFQVTMVIDKKEVQLDIDTGASSTLMSHDLFKQLWPEKELQSCNVRLRTYANEIVPIAGETSVTVEYQGQQRTLPLLVVEVQGPTLLGRNWLSHIRLDWPSFVCQITDNKAQLDSILRKHNKLFSDELGKLVGYKAKIHVDVDASRHVPFHMP